MPILRSSLASTTSISSGALNDVVWQESSPMHGGKRGLSTGDRLYFSEVAAPLSPKTTRTAQLTMKSMAKALAKANLQVDEDAWGERGAGFEETAQMSSALIKSKLAKLAIAQEKEEDQTKTPNIADLMSESLQLDIRREPVWPMRDLLHEEQRSLQHKNRNFELCKAFAKSGKPQPLIYRGVRGIDFLFSHSQARHIENLRAQESGETAEDPGAAGWKNRIERALDILSKSPFFRDMEKQRVGILQKLAKVAVFRRETPGQLLFRQFDPPGSCYVVAEGSVGVYVKKGQPNTPRPGPRDAKNYRSLTDSINARAEVTPPESRTLSKASGSDGVGASGDAEESAAEGSPQAHRPSTQRSKENAAWGIGASSAAPAAGKRRLSFQSQKLTPLAFSASAIAKDAEDEKSKKRSKETPAWEIVRESQSKDENGRPVWLTVDGFSIFAEDSDLGKNVATLEVGSIIGEVALLNDAPRTASIKCLEKCEFLIVRAKSFRKVLADFMDVGRSMSVLSGIKMFKALEDANPGIISGLASHAQFTQEVKDQVIFREGDPGQNCFVVVTGQVGVYIRKKDKKYPQTPRQAGETFSLTDWRRTGKEQNDRDEREKLKRSGLRVNGPQVFRTNEGFSFFTEESSFGDRVALLPAGTIFGELALQNSAPRAATIKCEKDSEVLVLRKQDYLDCIEGMLGKVRFFEQSVIGVSKVMDSTGKLDGHPSSFFKEETLQPGHAVLLEGLIAKPMICVVGAGGSVDFMRYKRPESNPAYILADRPQSAPANDLEELHLGKRKPGQLTRSFSDGILRQCVAKFPPPDLPDDAGTVLFDRLEAGGLFCSMAALPSPGVEPFTVVVSSPLPCKIYISHGNKIDKLPVRLLNIFRKHMANEGRKRLEKVQTPWTRFGHARREFPSDETELAITPICSPRQLNREKERPVRVHDDRTASGAANFVDGRRRAFPNFA
eukprot:TRINITY_DN41476_c0_g1_i1.p1 TRINITY_DN41476_c0_g1~~TRINITY_DN41476_c0_g1_i1.p1  ORF type:complete len:954 (-),score=170.71 TRINITY_DN41476_c0_g1_i1:109-2970(-)